MTQEMYEGKYDISNLTPIHTIQSRWFQEWFKSEGLPFRSFEQFQLVFEALEAADKNGEKQGNAILLYGIGLRIFSHFRKLGFMLPKNLTNAKILKWLPIKPEASSLTSPMPSMNWSIQELYAYLTQLHEVGGQKMASYFPVILAATEERLKDPQQRELFMQILSSNIWSMDLWVSAMLNEPNFSFKEGANFPNLKATLLEMAKEHNPLVVYSAFRLVEAYAHNQMQLNIFKLEMKYSIEQIKPTMYLKAEMYAAFFQKNGLEFEKYQSLMEVMFPDAQVERKFIGHLLEEEFLKRVQGHGDVEKANRWLRVFLIRQGAKEEEMREVLGLDAQQKTRFDRIWDEKGRESESVLKKLKSNEPIPQDDESLEAAVEIIKANAKKKLWHYDPSEYENLRSHIQGILLADSEINRNLAISNFERFIQEDNTFVRKYLGRAIFFRESLAADYAFDNLLILSEYFRKQLLAQLPLLEKISEMFYELQLLLEASEDGSLGFSERIRLLTFTTHIFDSLRGILHRRGQNMTVFITQHIGTSATEAGVLSQYALSDKKSATSEVPPEEMKSINEIYDALYKRYLEPPSSESEYFWRILKRLNELLVNPQEKAAFEEMMVEKNWKVFALLNYPVPIFDLKYGEFENIRKTLLELVLSDNLRVIGNVFNLFPNYLDKIAKDVPSHRTDLFLEMKESAQSFFDQLLVHLLVHRGFNDDFAISIGLMLSNTQQSLDPGSRADQIFRQGLEELILAGENSEKLAQASQKADIQKAVRWTKAVMAQAFVNITDSRKDQMSGIKSEEPGKTRFHRILEEFLSDPDHRQRYDEAMQRLQKRSEVREQSNPLITYVLAERKPSRSETRQFIQELQARGVEPVIHHWRRVFESMTSSKEALAGELLAVESLQAPDILGADRQIVDLKKELEGKGIQFSQGNATDVVLLLSELPQKEPIVSILKSELALNVLGILLPGAELGATSPAALEIIRQKAVTLEREVNAIVSSEPLEGQGKRFRLIVPQTQAQASRAVRDASRILYEQRGQGEGRQSVSIVQDRLVYVFPRQMHLEPYAEYVRAGASVEHVLNSSDEALLGKQFLLLKGATDISQETFAGLNSVFLPRGDQQYFFDDQRIPSEILMALKTHEAEIERHLATAA